MHLLSTLFGIALIQQTIAIPLNDEPSILRRSLSHGAADLSDSTLSARQILQRGQPPRECANPKATEKDGCYTLKDAGNHQVRFALARGQTFQKGIGEGNFGKVIHCLLKDGTDMALKLYGSSTTKDNEKSYHLLTALAGNNHIIKPYGYGTIDKKPALAAEFGDGGTLEARIEKNTYKGKEKETVMKHVASELLDGFAYMHSKKIAHGDINNGNPNIVFKGDVVKIIDFDFGCQDTECVSSVPGGEAGEASPEALTPKKADTVPARAVNVYGNDVWQMGRLIIRMATGQLCPRTNSSKMRNIWENDDKKQRVERVQKEWPAFTKEFAELLAGVFAKEKERIKMDEFKRDFEHVKVFA